MACTGPGGVGGRHVGGLNLRWRSSVWIGRMNPMKEFLILCVVTLACHGCATRPTFNVTIAPDSAGNRQFSFRHASGRELQNVKLTGWICTQGQWYGGDLWKIREWPENAPWRTGESEHRITAIEIDGSCALGKLKGTWSDGSKLPFKMPREINELELIGQMLFPTMH